MVATISGKRKIVLKAGFTQGGAEHEEGILAGVASPGMSMVMTPAPSNYERDTWQPGSTDYLGTGTGVTITAAPLVILKEDSLLGKTVDDAYASGDNALLHICKPGDVLQVLVASGENVEKTAGLSAGTDGKFVVDAVNPTVEAKETTGGALSEDTLVRCIKL